MENLGTLQLFQTLKITTFFLLNTVQFKILFLLYFRISGFTLGKQFNVNAQLDNSGRASGNLYALGGFNVDPGTNKYYAAQQVDSNTNSNNGGAYYVSIKTSQTFLHISK